MNDRYAQTSPHQRRSRFRRIAVASATAIAIVTAGAAAAPANALSLANDILLPPHGTPLPPGPAPGDYPPNMGYTPLFSTPQLRRNYTIRLVGTDSEPFRSAAAFAAQQFQMETVADVAITVAPGTIAEPSPSSPPNTGEILLDVAASVCGNATACTKYPTLTPWPAGMSRIDSGRIWLAPAVATYSTALIRTIVSHQLGHALGLDHNNTTFDGQLQVMNTVAQTWTGGAYQEGDKFGQSFVSPYGILQRNDTPPVALGPWSGVPERAFGGAWRDVALRGDWNGDGIDTLAFWGDRLTGVGAEQSPRFHLNEDDGSSIWIRYGNAGDIPIAGDWNGDGIDTIGVLRGDTFHLRNSNAPVSSFTSFSLANLTTNPLGPNDKIVTGDWNGDGIDTIGIYRSNAGSGAWYLANSNTQNTTYHIFSFGFGSAGPDKPVVGDWDGDGDDTVGVKRGEQWTLRNARTSQEFNLPQFADVNTTFGEADDTPLAGDWDGDGDDTVGVSRNKRF